MVVGVGHFNSAAPMVHGRKLPFIFDYTARLRHPSSSRSPYLLLSLARYRSQLQRCLSRNLTHLEQLLQTLCEPFRA